MKNENVKRKSPLMVTSMNIGFYLATPLLLGVFAGLSLDKWLHTKPLFTVICIVVGAIGTFYNLIKLTKESDAPH